VFLFDLIFFNFSDTCCKQYANNSRQGHLTNQSRVDQSQQTRPSDQSEQSRPITTDWAIWPIRAE